LKKYHELGSLCTKIGIIGINKLSKALLEDQNIGGLLLVYTVHQRFAYFISQFYYF